jgi:hypothetical protein
MARGALDVHVRGISSALELPGKIERARRKFKLAVGEGLVFEIRQHIHSRSGRLSESWKAAVTATGSPVVRSRGVEYAKASVGGAFIQPKKKQALHFADGRFARRVRLNPGAYIGRPSDRKTSYVHLAFAEFKTITNAAWHACFGDLK